MSPRSNPVDSFETLGRLRSTIFRQKNLKKILIKKTESELEPTWFSSSYMKPFPFFETFVKFVEKKLGVTAVPSPHIEKSLKNTGYRDYLFAQVLRISLP